MRTLHVYSGNLFGGIERTLITIARAGALLPKLQSHFCLCFEGTLSAELRKLGVPLHMLNPVRVSRPWTLWSARRKLRELLTSQPFDAVVAHACWSHVLAAPVARDTKTPFVSWAHDTLTGKHLLERIARRSPPDLIIANSRCTAATVRPVFPDAPIEVQYPPVATSPGEPSGDTRREVRAELGIDPSHCVILLASRLERWKGHTLLLDALANLKDKPDWTCLIAGGVQREHEQAYLDELRAQVRRAGIESRVKFLGQREDVNRLLRSADIHCQPNTAPEPFGIAFVEAMQAGVPVVTTAQGGPMETVDESCGVLTPPGDVGALAAALAGLIDNPGLRATLARGGPARAAALCDPTTVLTQVYEKFDRLLARKGRSEITASRAITAVER